MTVGIGAVCRPEGKPAVVVAADRMVTRGQQGGIEYESNEGKVETIYHDEELAAVAVGSGYNAYINEVIKTANSLIARKTGDIRTVEQLKEYVLTGYQRTVSESVENQVLSPLGLRLKDLNDEEQSLSEGMSQQIVQEAIAVRKQFRKRCTILLLGVGNTGAGIYEMTGSDFAEHTEQGFASIGTGASSAQLTFIRSSYEKDSGLGETLFTVMDAKTQAEERQGVGQNVDLVVVREGKIVPYDDSEIQTVRNKLSEQSEREKEVRANLIDSWKEETR